METGKKVEAEVHDKKGCCGTRVKSMKLPTAPVIKLVEQLLIYRFFFFIIVTLRLERLGYLPKS